MTVSDLINLLRQHDQDATVMLCDETTCGEVVVQDWAQVKFNRCNWVPGKVAARSFWRTRARTTNDKKAHSVVLSLGVGT